LLRSPTKERTGAQSAFEPVGAEPESNDSTGSRVIDAATLDGPRSFKFFGVTLSGPQVVS